MIHPVLYLVVLSSFTNFHVLFSITYLLIYLYSMNFPITYLWIYLLHFTLYEFCTLHLFIVHGSGYIMYLCVLFIIWQHSTFVLVVFFVLLCVDAVSAAVIC